MLGSASQAGAPQRRRTGPAFPPISTLDAFRRRVRTGVESTRGRSAERGFGEPGDGTDGGFAAVLRGGGAQRSLRRGGRKLPLRVGGLRVH